MILIGRPSTYNVNHLHVEKTDCDYRVRASERGVCSSEVIHTSHNKEKSSRTSFSQAERTSSGEVASKELLNELLLVFLESP